MKFRQTTLTIMLAAVSLAATAQAGSVTDKNANFTGFGIAATAAYTHNKVEYGGYLNGRSSDKNEARFALDASYGIPVSGNFIATVGATIDLNETKFGSLQYADGADNPTVETKLKNHWSVYLAPGVRLAPNFMLYAKAAYHGAKGEAADSKYGVNTRTHRGFGYGAGAAFAITRNVETGLEIQHVDFNSKSAVLSSAKPSFTEVTWRIGARF